MSNLRLQSINNQIDHALKKRNLLNSTHNRIVLLRRLAESYKDGDYSLSVDAERERFMLEMTIAEEIRRLSNLE